MRKLGIIAVTAACLCCAFTVWAVEEEIRVEGGGAAIAQVFAPIKESFEKAKGTKLRLIVSTPVKGLVALEKGHVDIATAAHPLKTVIDGAAREGVVIDPATLKVFEVGQNRVMAFVHRSNLIPSFTKEELRGIFTGKISNWKQLGGEDRPIIVVWGKDTPGLNEQFSSAVLEGAPVTKKARLVTDYRNIRDTVAATPGAIGINPLGFVTGTIRTPEIPLITGPVIIVTKGEPSPKVQRLLKYYEDEN